MGISLIEMNLLRDEAENALLHWEEQIDKFNRRRNGMPAVKPPANVTELEKELDAKLETRTKQLSFYERCMLQAMRMKDVKSFRRYAKSYATSLEEYLKERLLIKDLSP